MADYIQAVKKDVCMEAYLPSQLQTFVAIVISVVHLVVPLSQDHPPHHHSQVNTLSPKVKLFHLKTKYTAIILCGEVILCDSCPSVNVQERVWGWETPAALGPPPSWSSSGLPTCVVSALYSQGTWEPATQTQQRSERVRMQDIDFFFRDSIVR